MNRPSQASIVLMDSTECVESAQVRMTRNNGKVPIVLIRELCRKLEEHQIRYCHWKSNEALDRSASGENDLDLLIHRGDGSTFRSLVEGLGFKEADIRASTVPGKALRQ